MGRQDSHGGPQHPHSLPAHARRRSLQGTVVFATHVPALGRYAFLLHSYQPAHPSFTVEVLVNGGRVWQGERLRRAAGAQLRTGSPLGVSPTRPCRGVATRCGQVVCGLRGSRGPWTWL